ncbi:MAG: hypothetical protein K2L87_05325 [Clostridiales bacterium]|nr:hypothetical protein [Clostridiales bacterium]
MNMRVYFLSEQPAALFIGGIYLGIIDGFERSLTLEPRDELFVEIKPIGGFAPFSFRLDEAFLLDPPAGVKLFYTEHGVAVYACDFCRADQTLKVLKQERLGGALLTLCLQGKLQLNLENETGFHIIPLPESFLLSEFSLRKDGYLLTGEHAFALIAKSGEVTVLSEGRVIESGETLKAEIFFRDSMGHSAICEWKEGKLVSCSLRAVRPPTAATLALALFESALIGADCAPLLSEELQEKARDLKAFLGDFRHVILCGEPDRAGLVFLRRERIYDVRYFKIETENGKVSNISPV